MCFFARVLGMIFKRGRPPANALLVLLSSGPDVIFGSLKHSQTRLKLFTPKSAHLAIGSIQDYEEP